MKFHKTHVKDPKPKDGDTRTIKRFAWYKKIGNTVIVLEHYNEVQAFVLPRITSMYPTWETMRFELIAEEQN